MAGNYRAVRPLAIAPCNHVIQERPAHAGKPNGLTGHESPKGHKSLYLVRSWLVRRC